jgi:hypothetical protein
MPRKDPSVAVPPPGAHVPALDGVCGVAILMVLVLHLHLTTDGGIEPTIALDRLFCRLAMLGWVGVDLFFVLSGYLITGILYDTKGGAHCLRNFYVRRFLRIFPSITASWRCGLSCSRGSIHGPRGFRRHPVHCGLGLTSPMFYRRYSAIWALPPRIPATSGPSLSRSSSTYSKSTPCAMKAFTHRGL